MFRPVQPVCIGQGRSGPLRYSPLERVLHAALPPVASSLIKVWCRSCRVVECINEHRAFNAFYASNGAVIATWHQRMFYFFHYGGHRNIAMMISRSKDGEYANDVALRLGFLSVRGSSSREGRRAMHELIGLLSTSPCSAGMMADGPRGPCRRLKMGTVKIARDTGKPIIPVMYGARSKLVLKSWDSYLIPYPFTDVVLYLGEPVTVPPDAPDDECERIRTEVEHVMNEMADVCDGYWGGPPVGRPV